MRSFKYMSPWTVPHTTWPFRQSGSTVKFLLLCLCREAVCTIFMMAFGMTRPGRESNIYRVRGGHANHYANPTRAAQFKLNTLLTDKLLSPEGFWVNNVNKRLEYSARSFEEINKHFKRLGNPGFHDLFNNYLCVISKHNEYCKTKA